MTSKFAIHFTVHWPGQSRFSHSILIQDTKLSFLFSGTSVCAFISAVPIIKLFAWGEGDSGGHVLRETTSRGLCGLFFFVWTSLPMCVFITAVPLIKLFAWGEGEGDP
jgi:hypothetical protein